MSIRLLLSVFVFIGGLFLILPVLCVVPFEIDNRTENDDWSGDRVDETPAVRWAEAAFKYVHNLKCDEAFFTTSKECQNLVSIPKSEMVIHLAEPSGYGPYEAVLPAEPLTRADRHDAVLVLDPYPRANFGHLILVFYIDEQSTAPICQREGGIFLGLGDCMTLALRKRCKNALERRARRRNFARRCEINFLPIVHLETDQAPAFYMARKENKLHCIELPGFARCPELRPYNETTELICNPIRDNTQRCTTTHETIKTSCRVFEICDQAVILSGGWNRQTSGTRHKRNVEMVYEMLRDYGFKKRNIKIFFANGAYGIDVPDDSPRHVHPAAMKLALRYHLQKLCKSPHCVDSLVIYMNSPSKNDGTSLLWDLNGNGLAEEDEMYTVDELKSDLSLCAAKTVHIIIDQSYAGQIAEYFHDSDKHRNVIVFASSKASEYSFNDEYTKHWVSTNHTHVCSTNVHKDSIKVVKSSTPEMQEGKESRAPVKTTIFGAPCDVIPPFTKKELNQGYLGCQNLPTALWLMKILDTPDSNFPEPDSGEKRTKRNNQGR